MRDGDAQVPGAAQDIAVGVAVVGGNAGVVVIGHTRLREFLVHNPIQILLHKNMVVPMKNRADVVFDEQLVNGLAPARSLRRESVCPIGVVPAPLVETRLLDAAACIATSANQVVGEDKCVLGVAGFQGGCEPVVLLPAECPTPVVVAVFWFGLGGRVPERVEYDEQRVTPCPGIVAIATPPRARSGVALPV